jgi:hypothetical protein
MLINICHGIFLIKHGNSVDRSIISMENGAICGKKPPGIKAEMYLSLIGKRKLHLIPGLASSTSCGFLQ